MIYRKEIDGLRAIAVVPVILFHAGFSCVSGGYVGVDVFFVISGYLITSIILADIASNEFSLVRFYDRRARRILPALFVVMGCCIPLAWYLLVPEDLEDFSQSLMAVTTFVSNILFWQEETSYFNADAESKPLLHTWSLAVEEQFYLFFPLFLISIWRIGKKKVFWIITLMTLISLVISHWGSYHKQSATYFLLPTRAWELGIGVLIAFFYPDKMHVNRKWYHELYGIIGILLIFYSIFNFNKDTPFPSFFALIPVLGAAIIIMYTTSDSLVGKLLTSRVALSIGALSYSAYLWHQPLLAFSKHWFINTPSLTWRSAMVFCTFAIAWLSWKFIERPFRNRSFLSHYKIFSLSFIGGLIYFLIGYIGYLKGGFPGRANDPVASALMEVMNEKTGQSGCWGRLSDKLTISNTCRLGIANSETTFAIVGDSHAGSLARYLDIAASQRSLSGRDLTLFGCPVFLSSIRQDSVNKEQCKAFTKEFHDALGSDLIPHTLILSTRWPLWLDHLGFRNSEGGVENLKNVSLWNSDIQKYGYIKSIQGDYIDSIKRLLNLDYKVILVYPIPEMGWDVPKRLLTIYMRHKRLLASDASISYEEFRERNQLVYQALDSIPDDERLIRIYPENFLCNKSVVGRCVAQDGSGSFYIDDNHLSLHGAKLIVDEIIPYLSE